jgi:tetratricopeptide (TPR) repeat protein
MPNLLFGAAILLVPVLQARRERQKVWIPLMAATGPIILIGLGLMLYNAMRFDNPFEFGMRYQLAARRQVTERFFSLHYLWFNFRVYFLQPVHWSSRFPFVNDITVPPLPEGHGPVESPFGVLTNIPLVWLALAVPLAWRGRSGPAASILRWFVMTVALLFGICALTLGPCIGANFRYEVEFLPALVLLAVIGIFGLERALAPTLASNRIRGQDSGLAGRPVWRRAVRWGWGLLLGFSVSFNLLANVAQYAETLNGLGLALVQSGRFQDAIWHYEQALRIRPDYAEPHNNLGNAFGQVGNLTEAIAHYEQALRIKPEYAEAHCNLGATLGQAGRMPEAIEHLEHALRIKPDYAEAHNNLALAFRQLGNLTEAIAHYEQALRIKPDYAEAHCNLGATLGQAGRMPEAIEHLEHALRIKPDYAEAHYNLGVTLEQAGRVREAIGHYEQALRIKPDFAQAQNALAKLQARQ